MGRADVVEKLYVLVMAALADPLKEEILRLLLGKSDGLSFTDIENTLEIKSGAILYRNLNALQRACLVERTSDHGDPRVGEEPYYAVTAIGRAIIPSVPDAVRKAISDAIGR